MFHHKHVCVWRKERKITELEDTSLGLRAHLHYIACWLVRLTYEKRKDFQKAFQKVILCGRTQFLTEESGSKGEPSMGNEGEGRSKGRAPKKYKQLHTIG